MVNHWTDLGCCPIPYKYSSYPTSPRPQSYDSSITEPPKLFEPPHLSLHEIPPLVPELLPTLLPIFRSPRVLEPLIPTIPQPVRLLKSPGPLPRIRHHLPAIPQPVPILNSSDPLPRIRHHILQSPPPPPLHLLPIPFQPPSPEIIPLSSPPPPVILPIEPPLPDIPEPKLQLVPYIPQPLPKSCPHYLPIIEFRPTTPPLECPLHPRLIPLLLCPFHPHHLRSCPRHLGSLEGQTLASTMPFGNNYPRSAPATPFENIFRTHDNDAILRDVQARAGLQAAAALHPGYSVEEAVRLNDIRTINVSAQIANSTVTPKMLWAEVHPKLSTIDGRYPKDFDVPHRLGDIIEADTVILDRILAHYDIRESSFSSNSSALNLFSSRNLGRDSDRIREEKLCVLLQYLGVNVDSDSMGRGGLAAMSRIRDSSSGLGGKNSIRDERELGRAFVDAVGDNLLKAITNGANERGHGLSGRRQPRLGGHRSRDSSPHRD